jgi:glycosyltransferase involved in cell wall biosynthesis
MSFLAILISLIKLFNDKRPDVIHSHRQKENILSSLANALTVRAKCIRTQHGAPEFQHSWKQPHKKIQHWLDNFCGRFLQSNVIAVSGELAIKLEASFPKANIEVIENGVDIEALVSKKYVDEFGGSEVKSKHIGFVGRLVSVKRVDLFIEMAACLVSGQVVVGEYKFHIIGDGPLKHQLQQKVKLLGLQAVFNFHGHVSNAADYLASLDVLVMTSDHEGLPMTLLEAMVLGTPIVGHNVGAMKDALKLRKGGLLSKRHEAVSYAESVIELFDNDELNVEIIKQGKILVADGYSAILNAQKIISLYETTSRKS